MKMVLLKLCIAESVWKCSWSFRIKFINENRYSHGRSKISLLSLSLTHRIKRRYLWAIWVMPTFQAIWKISSFCILQRRHLWSMWMTSSFQVRQVCIEISVDSVEICLHLLLFFRCMHNTQKYNYGVIKTSLYNTFKLIFLSWSYVKKWKNKQ